ncbi:MAG TPA: acyltransferase [Vicinamibacterales bacterium]|nr:acyltransferase [Vicinamibacterales bacterium]
MTHNLKVDRLRGLFAVAVVVGHAYDISAPATLGDTFFRILQPARNLVGFPWVVGFVVLSGFCINMSCRRQGTFSFRHFWLLRATRLFPMLLAAVAVAAALEWVMLGSPARPPVWPENIDVPHLFTNLIGLGGFYGRFGSLAPSYTLSFELLYYLLWSLSLTFLTPRSASIANAAFVAAFLFFHQQIAATLPAFASSILAPFVIVIYIPWLLGAVMANHVEALTRSRFVTGIARLGWIALPLFLMYAWDQYRQPDLTLSSPGGLWMAVAYYGLLGGVFALIVIDSYRPGAGFQGPVLDARLGLLSYPLFLLHGPLIVFGGYVMKLTGVRIHFMWHFVILTAVSIAVSWLVATALERRVLDARARLRERASGAPPARVPSPVASAV